MRFDRTLLLAALLGAAAISACDSARPNTGGGVPTCLRCHGGTDNTTGAPPRATTGATAVSDMRVGSHSKHLAAGVACGTCHTVPDAVAFPNHLNGTADVVFNELARKNVPAGQQGNMWNATAGTCAVYCHGTGLNLGGALLTPVWNAPPANGLGCVSCHAAPPQTAPGVFLPPHTASTALTDCAGCHASSIVNVGNVPIFKAGGTHLNGQPDVSITGCTACHGDATRTEAVSLNQAAPPKDTKQNTSSPEVGAHQAHLHAGTLAGAFVCATCHVVPGDLAHSTANLGDAKVVFSGLGAKNAGATFAGSTCSNVYCHGATISGGTNKAPSWAGGASQVACGTCHGFPPPAPHTQAPTTAAQCSACHPGTVNANGTINTVGHVNGTVEVSGAPPHAVPFPPAQHGPLVKSGGVDSCKACHGADLNGGLAPSCTACHAANGHPTWQTECTFCHGSTRTADATFTLVGAPAVRANLAGPPLAATTRPLGAHEAHFSNDPSTGNALSLPILCEQCHGTLPSDYAAHMNGSVAIAWGTLATGNGATTPTPAPVAGQLPAASDVAAGPTCANYCHGATLGGGTNKTPSWTGGASQAACGTCHGFPPPAPHTQTPTTAAQCNACHPTTVNADGTINKTGHVNGVVEASGAPPHPVPFPPAQHGPVAKGGVDTCTACHGIDLNGGVAPSCTACHAANGHPTWQTECTFCHGAPARPADARFTLVGSPAVRANLAGPPLAATTRPLGAHEAHFGNDPTTGNQQSLPILCEQCHGALPTDFASHMNGAVAIAWGPLATGGGTTTPSPAPAGGQLPGASDIPAGPTCANYCHGATLQGGSNKTPLWTGGASQAACGTCHAVPQPYTAAANWHVQNPACAKCHGTGYAVTGLTAPATTTHVDGQLTLGTLTCTSCHGSGTFTTEGAANVAPPTDTAGAATGVKVGAHQPHVAGTTLRATSLQCVDCHGSLPSSTSHANGVIGLGFSALASTGVTPAPSAFNATWEAAPTCTNYCHGATLAGGSPTPPSWTGGASQATCGTCHGLPLPYTAAGGWHPQNTSCGTCHTGYTSSSVAGAKASHINGTVNLATGFTCTNCHSLSASVAAPFSDTTGSTATGNNRAGAHTKHLTTGITTALTCLDCHAFPSTTIHMNGVVGITWSGRASQGGVTPSPASGASVTTNSAVTCTTYCHGSSLPTGGTNRTPTWNLTLNGCGTCHGAPPNSANNSHQLGDHPITDCNVCHFSVMNSASNTTITNTSLHINGARNVQLNPARSGTITSNGNGSYSCSVTGCHGTNTTAGW